MTTTHIGRYEVKDLLGEGGMGQVYRAVDPKLQQEVAIKVINPALLGGEKVLIRAQRELQVLLSLRSHPNIVTVYDYVEEPFALVMELLQGRSLGTVIAEHPSGLPVDQLYRHACSMVEAVGFAHEMGIFHRDIKPGNIMVVELGHQDQIKVLDFGLAGFFQDKAGLTRTGARMGTAGYIAPEQHLGEEVDERTDIYALGVILFEMATGQSPFQEHAHSDYELMKAQIERPMTVASLFRAELSRSLDEIILRATARYQQDRYTSCEELLEDLRKADHGGHVDYGLRGVHLSPSNSPVLGPVPTTPPPPEVNTDMFRAVTEEMLASRTPPPLPQTKENNQLQSIPTP
ncbi:MAG: hypothetical protein CMH54_12990, partial [Myxococcales bacterium]|nr:hypothetical protein [Myxococcales bacterium]